MPQTKLEHYVSVKLKCAVCKRKQTYHLCRAYGDMQLWEVAKKLGWTWDCDQGWVCNFCSSDEAKASAEEYRRATK